MIDAEAFLQRYFAIDGALVKAGYHATSPWWKSEIVRFARSGRRRWVVRAGRRAGKSSTAARLAICRGLFGEWSVPPGDTAVIPFISVDRTEAAARLKTIAAILRTLGVGFDATAEEVQLRDRPLVFRVASATVRGVVGFTSVAIFCDEVARWENRDGTANPAGEVVSSLRPTIASQPSAFEFFVSSPFGTDDFHALAFDRGDDATQIVSHAPTWVANPSISERETHELEPDERVWAREFAAEPGATVSAALDPEDVAAAFGRTPRGQRTKRAFVAIDASSLRGDDFAWLSGSETTAGELVVDRVDGWEGPQLRRVSLEQIAQKLANEAKRVGAKRVFGDQREAAGLASLFTRQGILFREFPWSDVSKDTSIQWLRRALRERLICLPAHEKLRRELGSLKARLTPSGRIHYATSGQDYASALITLAHAAVAGDVLSRTDWGVFHRANDALNGGIGGQGLEPFDARGREPISRWDFSPGRGF